ncbi:hypothetical protein Barb6_02158 [Bacteroidales bacterium Barb6]|nr:hypothetical protein Barb6_02158 [Bacteroidales bacterium Barb6]
MRGEDDIIHFQQFGRRIIAMLEYIETGSLDNSRLQGFYQRRFINQCTARGIDENGGRLHLTQLVFTNQMAGVRGKGSIEGNKVGLGKESFLGGVENVETGLFLNV